MISTPQQGITMTEKSTEFDVTSHGELAIQTIAMPADANANGDIFGGWLLSQMDLAAGVIAAKRANSRVTTVALDAMVFHKPVFIGDIVSCYGQLLRVGKTSMTIKVEAWKANRREQKRMKVTEGVFTYVAIDEQRKPQAVDR
jgi:acyl-CoA thioesterase YciA